ncbi:MAG: twin-arginine translocase TatA/TatE family subunit [Myxococcales bacterium]|nr:twin-arginine translocase TatA/TatE family subunit [Myxococcales bacterium]
MWIPGPMELVIILAVVLIFGAKRLPEIGSGLGKGIKNFRKSFKDADEIDVTPESGKLNELNEGHDQEAPESRPSRTSAGSPH